MAGYAHIITLPAEPVPQYQFTYNTGGSSYARTFTEQGLLEFLESKVALTSAVMDQVVDQLRSGGRATVPELEIPDNETAMLGLQQVSSDY